MAKIVLPDDKSLAAQVIDLEDRQDQRKRESGLMGYLFGNSANQPGNVAGFAIIIACVMVAVLLFAPTSPDVPKRELLTLFASIVPGALGYYFGSRGGRDGGPRD